MVIKGKSRGFSLIEVLVALLVISVGVLGVAALQTKGLQYTQDTVLRNNAVMLANDLIEVMRANPESLYMKGPHSMQQEPVYSELTSQSVFYKKKDEDFGTAPDDCVSSPETAQEQRDCWLEAVMKSLPGADSLLKNSFYICRSSTPRNCDGKGSMLEIQLAWQVKAGDCMDASDPDQGTTFCTYRTRVEL